MLWEKIQKSRVSRWILIGVLLILAVTLLMWISFYIGFSHGGLRGFIKNITPPIDPLSESVVDKRMQAQAILAQRHEEVGRLGNFTLYGETVSDYCVEGRSNWKTSGGAKNTCSLRVMRLYGFDGDFMERMIAFDNVLVDEGWSEGGGSSNLDYILKHYYTPHLAEGWEAPASKLPDGRFFMEAGLEITSPLNYVHMNLIFGERGGAHDNSTHVIRADRFIEGNQKPRPPFGEEYLYEYLSTQSVDAIVEEVVLEHDFFIGVALQLQYI